MLIWSSRCIPLPSREASARMLLAGVAVAVDAGTAVPGSGQGSLCSGFGVWARFFAKPCFGRGRMSRRRPRKGVKVVYCAGRGWVSDAGAAASGCFGPRMVRREEICRALEACLASTFVGSAQFCSSHSTIGFSPLQRAVVCAVGWWCTGKGSSCSFGACQGPSAPFWWVMPDLAC